MLSAARFVCFRVRSSGVVSYRDDARRRPGRGRASLYATGRDCVSDEARQWGRGLLPFPRRHLSVSSLPFLPPIFHRPFVSSEVKIIRSFSLGLLLPRFFTSNGIYCHCAHDTKFVSLRCTFTSDYRKGPRPVHGRVKVATINRSFLGFTTNSYLIQSRFNVWTWRLYSFQGVVAVPLP